MLKTKMLAVIVNGRGGVGKDTLVDDVICHSDRHTQAVKYSSINDVKKLAGLAGWKGGKTDKDRKFLSDLKCLLSEYNNLPYNSCVQSYRMARMRTFKIWFCMVREPDEIDKLKNYIVGEGGGCATLLIRREGVHDGAFGNVADDGVEDYFYDYIFDNDGTIDTSKYLFRRLVEKMYKEVVESAE